MKTSSVVMPKVSQSILRNKGGVTGLGAGTAGPTGGFGGGGFLLSPVPPSAGFLPGGFFELLLLILGIYFYRKTKGVLSWNARRLSIQKLSGGCSDRFGRRPQNRWQSPDCSRQRSASAGKRTVHQSRSDDY